MVFRNLDTLPESRDIWATDSSRSEISNLFPLEMGLGWVNALEIHKQIEFANRNQA